MEKKINSWVKLIIQLGIFGIVSKIGKLLLVRQFL